MEEINIKSAEALRNTMLPDACETIREAIYAQARLGQYRAIFDGNLAAAAITIRDYLREQGYKVLVNHEDMSVIVGWWNE